MAAKRSNALMALDAPSLYFRAFYGVPVSVTAPDGTPVNAIRGLIDVIATLLRERKPDHVVACMDEDWRPAFRVAALPSYKAHRVGPDGGDQAPPELNVQIPIIFDVLDAVGIARIGVAGFEADDVIGTLASVHDGPVDIVTGDRDLFQLVRDDKPVRVLYTKQGIRNVEPLDEAAVSARYGIPGRGYGEFAVLRGDPSDGLPGVSGVGEKTAAELIRKFGTVAAVREAAANGDPELSPKMRHKILGAADYLDAAPSVVFVECHVPLPDVDTRVPTEPRDPERVVDLCDRYNLDAPMNRLLSAMQGATHVG